MTHVLKTWPSPFWAICSGQKRHEVRVNDRDFKVGDVLELHEFDREKGYSGSKVSVRVSYITYSGDFGLTNDVCVMSVEKCW